MTAMLQNLLRAFRDLFSGQTPGAAEQPDAIALAAATLLAEVARVDHDVKPEDLAAAREALQELFALSADKAQALVAHALLPENRPTSYHSIVSGLNRSLSMQDKVRLVECMWRVAHVDREIDMYEDHLVRKISDLLYLSHGDFIAARQRAKARRAT
jgi:uncharacterized tellurite resistance protein B-like protein